MIGIAVIIAFIAAMYEWGWRVAIAAALGLILAYFLVAIICGSRRGLALRREESNDPPRK